jgi:hypothetical protein
MYANTQSSADQTSSKPLDVRSQFAFLRKKDKDVLLVVANFSNQCGNVSVVIPSHAFDYLSLPEKDIEAASLLDVSKPVLRLRKDKAVVVNIQPYGATILKFKI